MGLNEGITKGWLWHAGKVNRAAYLRRRIERPRLAEMTEDFGLLAAELERCFGGTGTIPTRAQMRAIARTDLEKAIAAHGGPAAVAKRMGWNLAYKVRHCDILTTTSPSEVLLVSSWAHGFRVCIDNKFFLLLCFCCGHSECFPALLGLLRGSDTLEL